MPYKRSKRLPIQEKYATAMVLLRINGASEHLINRYRTLHPDKMKAFLPQMLESIEMLEGKRPKGWDFV